MIFTKIFAAVLKNDFDGRDDDYDDGGVNYNDYDYDISHILY